MITVTDRKTLHEEDRIAIAAEVVALLLDDWTQPQLAAQFNCSQTAVGKAIKGVIGRNMAEDIAAKLGTTLPALRVKHADVIAGKTEKPWDKWERLGRKPGTRADLIRVGEALKLTPLPPPEVPSETIDGAIYHLVEICKVPIGFVNAIRKRYIVTDPLIDSVTLAEDWLRLGRELGLPQGQPEERAEPPVRESKRSSRPVSR